ncbi:hypothetical protein NBO_417g0003 [Nosema bombycis CQ1]|uniref:Uncharacterized protein n=1 Tax=Nosema bombycis (strain CQ1 / CVCC 102059) TaxID=578461 RepID=R0MEJ6_NOSB1|nr:hypothetical protein NBO_417g0003 [Nosema bombycis CQ1]|eukprot:EOB12540.1 hypothetical protein NBO_417g0003 [Nosema bombycis CQ1]
MVYFVIFSSFVICLLTSFLIVLVTSGRKFKMGEEIRYGAIGSVWFGFVSWICVYLSQYKPFVEPKTNE